MAFFSALLFGLALVSTIAPAAEFEYIGPDQQQHLETMFNDASFSPDKDTSKMQSHNWTCEMFGMRSHMQVKRDLHLYKWASVDELGWHNRGTQLVSNYSVQGSELVGVKDRLQDQVKLTRDGQLVSRLSVTVPTPMVVAYSVCK